MVAVVLRLGAALVASWTVQDWVADPIKLQALADDTGCSVTVLLLAKIQPLEPTDIVRRAKAALVADGPNGMVEYHPHPERLDLLNHEEYPL